MLSIMCIIILSFFSMYDLWVLQQEVALIYYSCIKYFILIKIYVNKKNKNLQIISRKKLDFLFFKNDVHY